MLNSLNEKIIFECPLISCLIYGWFVYPASELDRLFVMQGLPSHFSKRHLPKRDDTVTLVDEQGDKWRTIYLARKTGLSGGWKKFSVDHDLVDGDALVFQLIQPTVFKVSMPKLSYPLLLSSRDIFHLYLVYSYPLCLLCFSESFCLNISRCY